MPRVSKKITDPSFGLSERLAPSPRPVRLGRGGRCATGMRRTLSLLFPSWWSPLTAEIRPSCLAYWCYLWCYLLPPGPSPPATSISPRSTVTPILHPTALRWFEQTERYLIQQNKNKKRPLSSYRIQDPTNCVNSSGNSVC